MKFKLKNMHIAVIVIGIIFNCISLFHSNIWFDEAYSVGLADKPFIDIWKIGGNDVHPILYYWILHIVYLITNGVVNLFTGSSASLNILIIAYRIFSAICISCLGIIGLTHIKKDFGEKTGILFSFFSYFLPVTCVYTAEIRMYSLAIVLVTLLAIYAYRLAKVEQDTNKNWIKFGIISLACIYVHYYGLMAAGIINVILLIYLIKQKRKTSIIKILTSGVIQLIAYIPWIMYLIGQMKYVAKGFWIGFEFPETVIELLGTQFTGNINNNIGFTLAMCLYIYLGYRAYKTCKNKKEEQNFKTGLLAIGIYFLVIIAALIITVLLDTSILYYRYLFVITGLLIFFISYYLSNVNKKYIIYVICGITLILAIFSNYNQIKQAYGKNNMTQISYLKENIQKDDVIVFGENQFGIGSVVLLNFTENTQYYYNPSDWGVKEAYKAFGKQLNIYLTTDFLNEITGRIWLIDSPQEQYYNELFNNENYEVISKKIIETEYEGYVYNLILLEKVQ